MNTYSRKTNNFFHSGIITGGYIVVIASIMVMFTNLVIGALFALLGLVVITGKEGIKVKFTNKKIKYYWGIFGLRLGKWEDLPRIEYVQINSVKKVARATSRAGKVMNFSSNKIQVRLYYTDYNDYLLAYEGSYNGAVKAARILSAGLKKKIVDKVNSGKKTAKKQH